VTAMLRFCRVSARVGADLKNGPRVTGRQRDIFAWRETDQSLPHHRSGAFGGWNQSRACRDPHCALLAGPHGQALREKRRSRVGSAQRLPRGHGCSVSESSSTSYEQCV